MAAIDFPASPVLNQQYVFNGDMWIWNGVAWDLRSLRNPIWWPASAIQWNILPGSSSWTFTVEGNSSRYCNISMFPNGSGGTAAKIQLRVRGTNDCLLELNEVNGHLGLTWYGSTVWTSGNDGAGSGLDADLLDGLNSTSAATGSTVMTRDSDADTNVRDLIVGRGIKFPASFSGSSDVNTFDDYEEGTWTPSLGGTATYTSQGGWYTKLGNMVFYGFRIIVNTIGTGSTYIVSGLPFSTANAGAGHGNYCGSLASNVVSLWIYTSGTSVNVLSFLAAANAVTANAIYGNGTDTIISGQYMT